MSRETGTPTYEERVQSQWEYAKRMQAKWDAEHQPAENPDWPMGAAMMSGNPFDDQVQHPERYID